MQDKSTCKSTIKKLISKIFDLRAFQILPNGKTCTPKRSLGYFKGWVVCQGRARKK